jgi:tetratricopeptide (TPR) repeat protein
MPQKIFISHSTQDDAQIDRIHDALEAQSYDVWVDHRDGGIDPGEDWESAIREGIIACDVGIFVMSEKSLLSKICKTECGLVLGLNKPLYVMRLEEVKLENIWLTIQSIQYADLVKDFDAGVQKIVRVLNGEQAPDLPQSVNALITGGDTMRLHLPYLKNPLRGREKDLELVQSELGAHVLQIVGTGGSGKSRLCAEIARGYPHGAIWHRCSSISTSNDIEILLRQHLGLDPMTPLDQVLNMLEKNPPILVVDNAEDVTPKTDRRADYVALLGMLIGRNVSVVLTSRTVWEELKPRRNRTLDKLLNEVGKQLALDFAQTEAVELDESQANTLAEKSRNHPRLIEFAVRQLHARLLERVLKQLDELKHADVKDMLDEMILKTVRQMASEAKHGTNAELLLKNMTLLQGSFDLKAIQALAPQALSDEDDLEDALETLQRWQFVRREGDRYRLGDLVREALGLPEDESVFERYADHYIAIAEQYITEQPENWHKTVDLDKDNILYLGDTLAKDPQKHPQRALDFAYNTNNFVNNRMEEKRWTWLEMGLAMAQQLDNQQRQALFANSLGFVWSGLGEKHKALDYYEQALPLRRQVGDKGGEVTTLNNIGMVWSDLGEKDKALEFFEQALPLRRQVGDIGGEATTLNNIGAVWSDLGEKHKALDYYEQALPLYRQVGDKGGEASTLNNIGAVWSDLGEKHKALDYYEQALPLYRQVGDKGGAASTLNNIGAVWSDLGEKHKALDYYEQALPLRRQVGDKGGAANSLNNIGTVWQAKEDPDKALEYFEQALPLLRQVGNKGVEATTLTNIGMVWQAKGEQNKALDYFQQALPLFRQVGDKGGEATTINNIGGVWSDLGEKHKALKYYEQALQIFIQVQAITSVVGQRANIAVLMHDMGKLDEAIRYMQEAVDLMVQKNLSHTSSGSTRAKLESDLASWKSEFQKLIGRYKALGGTGLRRALKQRGIPDAVIEELISTIRSRLGK